MRRSLIPATAVAFTLLSVALPAQAQDPEGPRSAPGLSAEESATRDDARERRRAVESELDLLRRSDVELKAESGRLSAQINSLEASSAAALDEMARLEVELEELTAESRAIEVEVAHYRQLAAERAVAAYMRPTAESSAMLLGAQDFHQADRMHALLGRVARHERSIIDQRLAAEAQLRGVRGEVEAARSRTVELQASYDADLVALREARARATEVEAALEVRIREFQNEADALAAQEARLTQLIAQRQAAVAASTTTVPPTTEAPTTTAPTTTAPAVTQPGTPGTPAPTPPPPPPTTAPAPPTTQPAGGRLTWPTPGPVTSPYGPRWGRIHYGIDIAAPSGQPIVAANSGVAFFVGWMTGYGNVILIDHGNGMVTVYAHQTSFAIAPGATVGRGQVIGYVGSTGNSTGPHLHFEVRINGAALNPMPYL